MQARISTRLTKALNVRIPILCAAMAVPGINEMATAVTMAGGFGFMGSAFDGSAVVTEKLQTVRKKLSIPPNKPLPIGIGFIGWILDKPTTERRIEAALDELPAAIWFSFGDDLGQYVAQVRAYEANRDHKTLVFVVVNSVADALRATNEWKVDALIVQGIESGGHGGSEAPPLLSLLAAVTQAIGKNGPLIVAAGGIATGAQIAALLAMGADGVALGTRLLFTHECGWSSDKKQVLVDADLNDTTRSMAFDEVNKTMGWPDKCDGRAISNHIIRDAEEGLGLHERMERFDASAKNGEKDRMVVWCGVGVGLTKEIKSASDVIQELYTEAVDSLQNASRLLL